ncbi:CocE/NonD family hydrolase [Aquabacterium lacunae]|uniref:CocE/NonD family hydrolase n=1 Tax=Aquabacterium lacunae TaxID=2528630 RepID=A0A4Q9H2R9_9BURK|nr:CocE/NonD family hydrolase [Aquabacterium lacunae]TBO31377.1 CocE/NonD family hydrolase [Aquabacterium lacunae]
MLSIAPHRHSLSRLAALLLTAGLCASAQAQTTTLGTRGQLSQASTPVTSNAGAIWKEYTRAAEYPNAVTLPLQFITTRTGQKLAVLVTVPADASNKPVAGRFPAILTQTAYRIDTGQLLGGVVLTGNTLLVGGKDEFMIRRGYVSVAVDVLGSGLSDGEAQLLGEAEQAAYGEAVEWVTKQAWFNGNLGLAGTSYLGITSLMTAGQQHPAVKAVFSEVPMGDAYRGTVGIGGLLNAQFISLWLPLTQSLSVLGNKSAQDKYPEYADQIAAATAQHVAAINSWYLPTVENSLKGQSGYATDDGSFWSVRSPIEKASRINVPTFIIGSSNDIFQRDEPLLYEQLKQRVNTKLVVLPGSHIGAVQTALSGASASSGGAPEASKLMLQWFDQYLKGMNTGAAALPNVTQFVQGYGSSDKYARSTDWPHPQMTPQRLYLRGNGGLTTQAPAAGEAARTVSEPKAPVVTYAASSDGTTVKSSVTLNDGSDCSSSYVQWSLGLGGLLPKACYTNSNTVERAQGALIFETAPLQADMYLNGPMQADIWMSSTKREAAVAVRVDAVDIWGKATPISTGLMSAAFRAVDPSRSRYVKGTMIQPWHPFTTASRLAVVPGQPMLVPVEVFPAAALVKKGQKLRVAISASNQAMGIWPQPQQAEANGGVNTFYNDPARPSSIVLPLVPVSALN